MLEFLKLPTKLQKLHANFLIFGNSAQNISSHRTLLSLTLAAQMTGGFCF
jgi:hypothetical protein